MLTPRTTLSAEALAFLNELGPMDMARWRWLAQTLPGCTGWPEQEIIQVMRSSGLGSLLT